MKKMEFTKYLLSTLVGFAVLGGQARAEEPGTEAMTDAASGQTVAQQLHMDKSGNPATDWMVDVASRLQVHGYAQGWFYAQHAGGKNTNTFLCRRTLLWANARITDRWSFQFMHDFNSVVQEYYTDFRVTRNNLLTVRLGQFKTALTIENPLSPTLLETVDVCAESVTFLTGCGSDPLNGVQFGRDQGISLFGETDNKKFRYELQVLNGTGVNIKDRNNKKDVIARLEVRPVAGLNICATGQLGTGNALVDKPVFNPELGIGEDYRRDRWSVGFNYKSPAFNCHGEYVAGKDGKVSSQGAYCTGSARLAALSNQRAVDFVWSYDYFNFNKSLDMDMHKVVTGFQYWFFKQCRFQAQYVYRNANTDYRSFFEHGANHQFICQMQVRFN